MTTGYALSISGRCRPGDAALPRRARPRYARRLRAFLRLINRWRRARRRLDDLRHLDERTLRDIGIARSELPSVVAELGGRAAPTRRRVEEPRHVASLRIRAVDTSL